MYLSKLRIFGFKSFANKVEVNFPGEGITSVVGPNGCGKSNIIDAIRWVLGEQRAKALRSSKMEDVIFSGTADRSPMGLAEVSLLINNDSGVLPSGYSQIMITRRSYRDGETEYLINNQPCRLKDVHNLFYDTGMGAASYSLIEAKMIDSILSDKAEERRVMFEEASGISKYKQQRKETLRQLERTSLDLTRVEDNLRYLRQNVNLFEKQAKKAERWRELRKAAVSLELSYQSDLYADLERRLRALEKDAEQNRDEAGGLQSRITLHETQLEEGRLLLLEDERNLGALNQAAAATQAEIARLDGESERCKDRVQYLQESAQKLAGETSAAQRRLDEIALEKTAAREESAGVAARRAEWTRLQGGHAGEQARLQADYAEKRRRADELAEERLRVLEELSALSNQAGSTQTEVLHLQADDSELDAALQGAAEKITEFSVEKNLLQEEIRRLRTLSEGLAEKLGAGSARLRASGSELETLRTEERERTHEKVALETRFALLQGLQESMEGVDGGVQHLLEKSRPRIQSLLADALRVPDDAVAVVEKCLGRFLQAVLVGDQKTGLELLEELRSAEKGEALLFGPSPHGGFARPRSGLDGAPGFQGWLIDRVEAPPSLRPLLELALGHFALVENLEAAMALPSRAVGQDVWFVTPAGEMAHTSGMVSGGSQKNEQTGLLRRKLLLEQTGSSLRDAADACASLESRIRELETERRALEADLEAVDRERNAAERKEQEQAGKLAYLETSLSGLEAEKSQFGLKLESVRRRLGGITQGHGELRGRLERGEESRRVLENRFRQALDEAQQAEAEKTRFEESVRDLDRSRTQLEAQAEGLRSRLEYLDRSESEQRALIAKNAGQREEWETQSALTRERMSALGDQIQALHQKLTGEERTRDEAKSLYDGKALRLDETRLLIRNLNEELRNAVQAGHACALKTEQARAAMAGIRERMYEAYEVDLSREERAFERVEYDPDTVAEAIAEYKEKLKGLGNINAGALEDYEAEKARLEEVQKQYHDLEKARDGLEKAIKKLDKVAREQFLKTFEIVQKNFQEVFSSLFEGGEAQLALEEAVDPLDARIEINARPTGKKMRGVALLSGGERALTAISLLFALYLVRPSPYCIMDEVDGPLDDANIGRFVHLLRRFSHQTQFIVVTHNKRTMAASDMLYGVTQEVKGISKLVSVQLDEAGRLAN